METIKSTVKLHNFFTIEVRDATSGELKQTARAENIVLNNFFKHLGYLEYSASAPFHNTIAIGRGTGTLDRTRTTLFNEITKRAATLIDIGIEGYVGRVVREISIGPTEFNGETITEVGFVRVLGGSVLYHETHAFLQDSEGAQISVLKTDTDIVTIRGTFYVTAAPGTGLGSTGIYNTSILSTLQRVLLGEPAYNPTTWKRYFAGRWPITGMFEMARWLQKFTSDLWNADKNMYARAAEFRTIGDVYIDYNVNCWDLDTMTITVPLLSLVDTSYPNQVFRCIGGTAGVVNLPNHDFFPPYHIVGKSIGAGDGATLSFNIGVPVIMPDTEVIYVDGVAKTKGTDYSIEYDNNCVDMYENFFSCQYGAFSDNVNFGTAKSQTPATGSARRDPLLWCAGLVGPTSPSAINVFPAEVNITEADPIWFDFLEPKRCNIMKVVGPTIPAAQIDNVVIEYSTDNETWTAVSGKTRSLQEYRWTFAEARYWRVYIPSYTWAYPISSTSYGKTVNGVTYYATFFLGAQTPGLTFLSPPANNAVITADMDIDVIFKTANNILRFQWSMEVGFGEGS